MQPHIRMSDHTVTVLSVSHSGEGQNRVLTQANLRKVIFVEDRMVVMSTHLIGLRVAAMHKSDMVIILDLVVEMYKAVVVIMAKVDRIFQMHRVIGHFVTVATRHEQNSSQNRFRVHHQIPRDHSALVLLTIGQSTINLIDRALHDGMQAQGRRV